MKADVIQKIDKLQTSIYQSRKKSKLKDMDFSISPKIKEMAFEMVTIFAQEDVQTSYNNLTNMNYHMLVQILNYNGFFDKSLKKEYREELKTFPLIK